MKGLLFTIVSFFFILLLSISYFSKKSTKNIRIRLYRYLLIVEMILLVSELISTIWIIYGPYSKIPYVLLRIHWYTGVLWFTLLYYYSVVFVSEIKTGGIKDIVKANTRSKIIFALFAIGNIAFFFVPFSKINANDNFSYLPGAASYYVYGYAAICTYLLIIYLFKNSKNAKKIIKISIWAMVIEMHLDLVFQLIFPTISIAAVGVALQLYFLYFNIENPDLELISEIESSKEEIDKSSKAKTDFLSNMSHEIRSPMNAIIGFSESLVNGNFDDETVKNDIANISQAGNNLLDIINNILDISKIETGKETIILKEYYISNVLDELQKIVETRLADKPIKYIVEVDENIPCKLYGDSVKLFQVLLNILTNSVKYTEVGKIILYLKYETNNNNNEVLLHFKISDTGYGIKKEDFDKLFEKFSRLDLAVNKEIEGTGLGLLITKKYVDLMGGKIWFDSQYQVGTNFYIDLKQKIVDNTPLKEMQGKTNDGNRINLIDCSNYKALLVDDNKLNLKVAHKLLSKYGFQIEEVTSGKECINKIKDGVKYDIIFLDHMMPEMDGIEVLHVLKELRDYEVPPIVALTANAISGMKEMYLKEGFDDYLSKPINIGELDRIITKYFLAQTEKKFAILEVEGKD